MGIFYREIEVANLAETKNAKVQALVDSGSSSSILPRTLLEGLGISPNRFQRVRIAAARTANWGIGHANIRAEGRVTATEVVFDEGDVYVLGAHALEGLLLLMDTDGKRLIWGKASAMSSAARRF